MKKSLFGRRAMISVFFEMWPGLVMGILIFIFILLMFQALRLTEFFLVHGVSAQVVGQIVLSMALSFLPALFPMALLFAVVLTYGRLSQDSEILALRSLGYSPLSLLSPAVVLSLLVALMSAQTSFHLAPWGNRQFELLISEIGQSKASATIKAGTFSEGFFDLVIYANEVHGQDGSLGKVFIYDERSESVPLTILAKSGKLTPDPQNPKNSILLQLKNGDIHRKTDSHTKIKFDDFDIRLVDPSQMVAREKTPPSLSLEEIQDRLNSNDVSSKPEERLMLLAELHKRWAISAACLVFGFLGSVLGTQVNRRVRANGLILSLIVIVVYWILYVSLEGAARTGQIPVPVAIWLPNFLFLSFGFWKLRSLG